MTAQKTKVITLDHGFKQGDAIITELTLHKPNTGHCRGLNLKDVLSFDINALATLLPRITSPAMSAQNVYELELMDTLKFAEEIFLNGVCRHELLDIKRATRCLFLNGVCRHEPSLLCP